MTTKRAFENAKAASPRVPSQENNVASLKRITRALESVTRVADAWTSGFDTRFPLPALAFKSDGESVGKSAPELSLPLRPEDCELIKARGVVSQRHEGADVAWDVCGDLIESRNPSWHAFLDAQLVQIRRKFGMFKNEEVKLSLRKMTLAETGARLMDESEGDASIRPSGAFGTFVVVLPGSFDGGEVDIVPDDEDEEEDEDDDRVWFWWPDDRPHAYYISYAAFYDHCRLATHPVTSGSALYLVFDLVTSPKDVDLLHGAQAVQQCVNRALDDHFQVLPDPLVKRLKISTDAWETVREFTMDRNFVYLLQDTECRYGDPDKAFDDLKRDDRLVADCLASFCAHTKGEYVLYLARMLCSRLDTSRNELDDSRVGAEKTSEAGTSATLKGPWIKFGDTSPIPFPPLCVDHIREVVPSGRIDQLPLSSDNPLRDRADIDITEHLYGEYGSLRCVKYTTYALVVLPRLVESSQLTKVPIPDAVVRLRAKLSDSREDALLYARRVISYRPEWEADPEPAKGFPDLVSLLVEINDHVLFTDFLQTLELCRHDETKALRNATQHFGWDVCESAIIRRLLSASTLRGRVNLFVSVVDPYEDPARVVKLLEVLLSQHPWADAKVDQHTRIRSRLRYTPDDSDFCRLLAIVRQSCAEMLTRVVSVNALNELVGLVASATASFVEANLADAQAWRALFHVRDYIKAKAPEIRNAAYSEVRVEDHCDKCGEIQAFLSSTAIEKVMQYTHSEEIDHVEAVLESSVRGITRIEIDTIGNTAVRLTKCTPHDIINYYLGEHEKKMIRLLARTDRPEIPNDTWETTSTP